MIIFYHNKKKLELAYFLNIGGRGGRLTDSVNYVGHQRIYCIDGENEYTTMSEDDVKETKHHSTISWNCSFESVPYTKHTAAWTIARYNDIYNA